MEIISTHQEAEFDSFASMVAAKKLYPGATLVFPGSQERALREYLKSSPRRFGAARLRTIDPARVTRVILVDTRRRDRIGALAAIVARPGVEVHVYDHHPASPEDLKGALEVIEEVGANTTLMVEQLRKRGLAVSPEEATLLAIGIYEDTGSLSFASTTPRDLVAAAWLLEQGANLNIVADRTARDLTPEQVLLLNDLLRSLRRLVIRGVEVGVASASRPGYVGDLSVLAGKLREMENLGALFVAVRMGARVYVVGRSRIGAVDAGAVAQRLGGGGHPTASAAAVREPRLAPVKRRLLEALRETIVPPRLAREIMTHPVTGVERDTTLAGARKVQLRTGLHVLPVLERGRFLGLLARPVTEKAVRHGFGESPVSDYMTTELETVPPTAPFARVEEVILGRGQRFLPVTRAGRLVGAITRTDYLRALRAEAARVAPAGSRRALPREMRRRDVRALIRERVPAGVQAQLAAIGQEAEAAGLRAYLVGGWVRDLLLHEPNLDLDVMVEGDGIAFARRLGERLGGRVHAHPRFETAVVALPGGEKIDVATARAEYYESPGALPTVVHGNVKMDLLRRDFTVNALAIELNPARFGTLLDFFGGLQDLHDRVIQVLHSLSFVEDPTRVFRAIRFEQRLHFRLGESTRRLIRDAVAKELLETVGGARIFGELAQILKERNPLPALARMEQFGVLRYVHPRLRVTRSVLRLFGALRRRLGALAEQGRECCWVLYLAALCEGLGPRAIAGFGERLAMPPRTAARLRTLAVDGRRLQKKLEAARPWRASAVHALLAPWPREVAIYVWARTTRRAAAEAVRAYLATGAAVATELKGRDLLALGYRPGPIFREILAALLAEKLEGRVGTREDELAWVKAHYPL